MQYIIMRLSLVAKISSIKVLISLATNLDWPLYQLDVKNDFLHGDLLEVAYMEQGRVLGKCV